jgi:hypothetical protein
MVIGIRVVQKIGGRLWNIAKSQSNEKLRRKLRALQPERMEWRILAKEKK